MRPFALALAALLLGCSSSSTHDAPAGSGAGAGGGGGVAFMATYPGCARYSNLDSGGCQFDAKSTTRYGYVCETPPAGCVMFGPGFQCCPKVTPGEPEWPASGAYVGCKSTGGGQCTDKPATPFEWPSVCGTLPSTCVAGASPGALCCPDP